MVFDNNSNFNNQADPLLGPIDKEKPDSVLFNFFLYILKGQCDLAWDLLTKNTRQNLLDSCYDEMTSKQEFYLQDEITTKDDLKKAFENNHPGLKTTFWLSFAVHTSADYLVEYALYRIKFVKDKDAVVETVFKRKDGQEIAIPFNMLYEDSSWRVALTDKTIPKASTSGLLSDFGQIF